MFKQPYIFSAVLPSWIRSCMFVFALGYENAAVGCTSCESSLIHLSMAREHDVDEMMFWQRRGFFASDIDSNLNPMIIMLFMVIFLRLHRGAHIHFKYIKHLNSLCSFQKYWFTFRNGCCLPICYGFVHGKIALYSLFNVQAYCEA